MWDEEYWHLENLMNLEQIGRPHGFQLCVLPVKWVGHDGRAGARGGDRGGLSRARCLRRRALHRGRARRRQGRVAGAHDRARAAGAARLRRARRRARRRRCADGGARAARRSREREDAERVAQDARRARRPTPAAAPRRSPTPTRALGDGDVPVAVRSSATRRGLRGGQLRRPAGDLPARARRRRRASSAIRDCWASFFSERALFYRQQKGSLDDLGMAVVVQRMVERGRRRRAVHDRPGPRAAATAWSSRRCFGLGEARRLRAA